MEQSISSTVSSLSSISSSSNIINSFNSDNNSSDHHLHNNNTILAAATSTISPLISMLMNSTTKNAKKMLKKMSTTTTTTTVSSLFIDNDYDDKNFFINDHDYHSNLLKSDNDYVANNSNIFVESHDYHGFILPNFSKLPTPIIILSVIALIFIAWVLIKIFQALWSFFFCYLLGFGVKWRPGSDSWAVVTGSTDGIGLAYAKAMAKKGYCVFLLSRNQEKLDKVKAQILNECPNCPQIKLMAVDFTLDTIYEQIRNEINSLNGHVHVLINNVGMAYKYPEYFTKIPNLDQFITNIMNCNMLSVTRMTHIILPLMEQRRSGVIINVASYSALFPTPFLALYSASKIYMDYFSRALHYEYADRGITIQSVLPYYVSTNMIRNPSISFMIPSPDEFVKSALRTVGVEKRTYGYFAHNILAFFQSFIVKFIIGNNLNTKIAYRRMRRLRKGCYQRKGLSHHV